MDNTLLYSFFNHAGAAGYGSGVGFGFDLSVGAYTPETIGGMDFGPTPDGQLSMAIGPKSRGMSNLGYFSDHVAGFAMGANRGFGDSVAAFLHRPPIGVPQLGVQMPGMIPTQPTPAASRAGGGGRGTGGSRMSVSNRDNAGDAKAAADAKNIDELAEKYREANSDAGVSYSAEEMDRIIEDARTAADGDYARFKDIMKALPARDDENWVRKFGEWHAEHIGGVDGNQRVSQLVSDTASSDGVKFGLKKSPHGGTKVPYNRFQVTSVDGESDVEQGDFLFYSRDDNKFYKSWDKENGFQGEVGKASEKPIDETGKSKPTVTLDLGAGSDYVELTPDGVHVGSTAGADGHTKVFDRYVVGEDNGDKAGEFVADIEAKDGALYVYYDNDTKQYFYDPRGEARIKPLKGELVDGRFYFSRGGHFDEDSVGSVTEYMDDLAAAEDGLSTRLSNQKEAGEQQKTDRAERAWTQLVGMMSASPGTAGKMNHVYDAGKGLLTITCDKDDCEEVKAALEGGNQPATKGDAILREFPKGTKVVINPDSGHGKPFTIGSKSFGKLTGELARENPAVAHVIGKISLAHLKNKDRAEAEEAVFKRLNREVEKQLDEHHNPKYICFDDEIILPEGKIDQAAWERIKSRLSSENDGVTIVFLDGDSKVKNIAPYDAADGFSPAEKAFFDELDATVSRQVGKNPSARAITVEDYISVPKSIDEKGWEKINKALSEKNGGRKVHFEHVLIDKTGKEIESYAKGGTYKSADYDRKNVQFGEKRDGKLIVINTAAGEHYKKAKAHYDKGDYEKALAEFIAANNLQSHPATYKSIAECHAMLGRYDKAIEALERALSFSDYDYVKKYGSHLEAKLADYKKFKADPEAAKAGRKAAMDAVKADLPLREPGSGAKTYHEFMSSDRNSAEAKKRMEGHLTKKIEEHKKAVADLEAAKEKYGTDAELDAAIKGYAERLSVLEKLQKDSAKTVAELEAAPPATGETTNAQEPVESSVANSSPAPAPAPKATPPGVDGEARARANREEAFNSNYSQAKLDARVKKYRDDLEDPDVTKEAADENLDSFISTYKIFIARMEKDGHDVSVHHRNIEEFEKLKANPEYAARLEGAGTKSASGTVKTAATDESGTVGSGTVTDAHDVEPDRKSLDAERDLLLTQIYGKQLATNAKAIKYVNIEQTEESAAAFSDSLDEYHDAYTKLEKLVIAYREIGENAESIRLYKLMKQHSSYYSALVDIRGGWKSMPERSAAYRAARKKAPAKPVIG